VRRFTIAPHNRAHLFGTACRELVNVVHGDVSAWAKVKGAAKASGQLKLVEEVA
jgi:hypothetical protein